MFLSFATFVGAKVRIMFYIASDLLKTLRMINKISWAIYKGCVSVNCRRGPVRVAIVCDYTESINGKTCYYYKEVVYSA